MHIKSIRVQGFRNYHDTTIEFNEGVNVIIGHNNAGKTNLLKALSLILDNKSSRRLEVDDFNKYIDFKQLQAIPPKITITLTIVQSIGEDLMGDDLVTVSPWLTELQEPYTAMLTYVFFLPESEHEEYITQMAKLKAEDKKSAWLTIKHEFLRKYLSKIYGGNPDLQTTADTEALNKFDYQFLHAIRDVERDMFTGRNTLLREVIDFFMDYEIKNDSAKSLAEKMKEITTHKLTFSEGAQSLIALLRTRMEKGREHIMKYAEDTGAAFNSAKPEFDGQLSEVELYSALRLIISYSTGIEIPATHNGLGYNNLIYMSLLLAKMQVDTNGDYLGSNAKVFPVLVIEEPEAHLHPSLQYKFLKFLHDNKSQKARQVFITSHSTNITAAVGLDQIICLHTLDDGKLNVGYPGKVFTDDDAGKNSKAYVQRFLDATRSDMLFARNIILVEGIAEQLLLPTLARCNNKSLEDSHTATIHIGGRYFDHFLKIFDSTKAFTINKKVACITDRDPTRKNKTTNDSAKKCYPFEVGQDNTYEYSTHATELITKYSAHPNIRFFSQHTVYGKTLEYQLMFDNPSCKLLITESTINQDEIASIEKAYSEGHDIDYVIANNLMLKSAENERILKSLKDCKGLDWDDASKMKALLAARYLNSVGKGGNALEIADNLEMNQKANPKILFTVPEYLTDAINWTCP
ncbi:MAG: AAA family ATPase [Bacteroidetes bacterium]|nr:AAA family ATPase [Bacteroidota bacterium]